jgi:prepilin-type processing-associated H-X9-DG protein
MARRETTFRIVFGIACLIALSLAAAVLLGPVRERANRWKCRSNLSAIGQIMMLYADEHRGAFPPDLGTLAWQESATAQVFICPDSGTYAPSNLPPDHLVAWVNTHSDYVYVAAGINQEHFFDSKNQRVVLAYEKEQNHHGAGMNVLFGDGHVEWMTIDGANGQLRCPLRAGQRRIRPFRRLLAPDHAAACSLIWPCESI